MCLRGRREFSQPSEEFLKLVMVMDKEAWVSYMLPSPACYWFSMPAFPLAGICQGFLRTCIYVNGLGNYAMTSIACVILHHSLAFFPCPDTLNNCYPDCSSTIVDCSQHKFATGGKPRQERTILTAARTVLNALYLKSEDLGNAANYLCDLG